MSLAAGEVGSIRFEERREEGKETKKERGRTRLWRRNRGEKKSIEKDKGKWLKSRILSTNKKRGKPEIGMWAPTAQPTQKENEQKQKGEKYMPLNRLMQKR